MKNTLTLSVVFVLLAFSSCTTNPEDRAKYAIQTYLKVNLNAKSNYEPISFSTVETLSVPDTMTNNQVSFYKVRHTYSIKNDLNVLDTMSIDFYLDKDMKVTGADTESLTGIE